MMPLLALCFLMAGESPVSSPSGPRELPVNSAAVVVSPPQGVTERGRVLKGPNSPQSGGTPEPVTVLLLAGGALGYGFLRMRRGALERSKKD